METPYLGVHQTGSRPERAEYTDKALALWSTWVGVDVSTLKHEAQAA